ncbi:hypothetical protein C0J45_23218, partial [Silurus meridionalis]
KQGSTDASLLETGIVVEGKQVIAGLQSIPAACVILFALIYAGNLSYPKPLRYTFKFFQKNVTGTRQCETVPKD